MKKIFNILLVLFLLLCISCKKNNVSQKTEYPQKIVSLSPASTEILFAIDAGSQVVAVSQYSDYPPEAAELPVAGGFDGKSISIETLLSFQPDFVYLSDGMHNFLIPELEQFNIKYYLSNADSISSIIEEIQNVSRITGHEKKGNEVVNKIYSQVKSIKTNKPVSVYWEVWNAPYMSAGSSSFINDVIKTAGGTNIFAQLDDAYPIVSEETIILNKPEVILIPASSGISVEMVKNRAGWKSIPAVENNQIFIVDDNLYTRPGPRIGAVIQDLNYILTITSQN